MIPDKITKISHLIRWFQFSLFKFDYSAKELNNCDLFFAWEHMFAWLTDFMGDVDKYKKTLTKLLESSSFKRFFQAYLFI